MRGTLADIIDSASHYQASWIHCAMQLAILHERHTAADYAYTHVLQLHG